jgi:hypothetical protein
LLYLFVLFTKIKKTSVLIAWHLIFVPVDCSAIDVIDLATLHQLLQPLLEK